MQFLKRHPYATILFALLLVCTMIDWTSWKISGSPPFERYYGVSQGHFIGGYFTHNDPANDQLYYSNPEGGLRTHRPELGSELKWGRRNIPSLPQVFEASIPLYLPLLALLGWIAFLEFKRKKT
jgi:hypothetical protein